MSILNSVSNAITSSTWSSESAPRSSVIDASGVTSDSSTPSCSSMIFFTLSKVVDITSPFRPCCLLNQDSAIDHERLSGDVPGGVGAKKCDDPADVLRLPGSTESGLLDQKLPSVARHLLSHGGFDETRRDGVDSYIPRTQLLCQRFAEADQSCLRGGIRRPAGITRHAHDARHQHDRSGALLHHRLSDRPTQIERRFEIDVEQMVDRLRLQSQQQRIDRLPGVRHRAIDLAEARDYFVDDALDRLAIGHVAFVDFGNRPRARAHASLGALPQRGRIPPDQRHVGAVPRELDRDGAADPAARSGNQSGLSRKPHTRAPAEDSIVFRNRSTPAKSLTTLAGGAELMRFIRALSTPLAPNSTTMSG